MTKVELIPILKDNYVFLIINTSSNEAIAIDPGEADKTADYLEKNNLKIKAILITHHHNDHIAGVDKLKRIFKAPVYAPLKNQSQINADYYIKADQSLDIAPFKIKILDLPGHTLGHCAYWFVNENWLFSGDVLFGLGCGRLFEGTPEQAFASLQKIKSLPDDTQIFCTHEYTEKNLEFCKTLPLKETEDFKKYEFELHKKRILAQASVPLSLSIERKVNPFLLAQNVNEFMRLRQLRNEF